MKFSNQESSDISCRECRAALILDILGELQVMNSNALNMVYAFSQGINAMSSNAPEKIMLRTLDGSEHFILTFHYDMRILYIRR